MPAASYRLKAIFELEQMTDSAIQLEAEIKRLAASGDPAVTAKVYDFAGRELYGYLAGLTGSVHDAEELLNDLFIKIVVQSSSLAKARNVKAYLYRMAANLAYDRCRQQQKRSRHLSDYAIILETGENTEWNAEKTVELNQAMTALPPEQREVIIMKFYLKKTFGEIAADLNIPLPTVTSRYRYALQKLKTRLEEER